MKQKTLIKLMSIVVLAIMTTTILVSGTYAKYTTVASGINSTVVAKWSFMVGEQDITVLGSEDELVFDLFNTASIKDSDGGVENDVEAGVIAPGTTGSFEFVLKNTSDVTAKYDIKLTSNNENIPIEYSIDGATWTSNLAELVMSEEIIIGGTKNVMVQWKWPFNDETDASLSQQTLEVTAKITATQVDYLYLDQLDKNYELTYYNDAAAVVAAINNTTYEGGTSAKEEAELALYTDDNNVQNLVVVKNTALNTTLTPTEDLVVDLAGKTLTFNTDNAINADGVDVSIKAEAAGSKLTLANSGTTTTLVSVTNGTLTISGGEYETKSNGVGTDASPNPSILVGQGGSLTASDIKLTATDATSGTLAGILVEEGGTATVTNSQIELTSLNGLKSDGVRNYGTMTLVNTSVQAYANYTANAAKTDYATNTRGINNEGTMTLKNCYVYGTHSGVRSAGPLYVDGGTYEGYGHGGIYFSHTGQVSYVKNASLRQAEMKVGYDDGIAGTNRAGCYIGGGSNIVVYMDNCDLYGQYYPMVIRSSGSEGNNSLYISNSRINEDRTRYPRNDGSTNRLYIGSGNNFDLEDTYKEEYTVETGEDYSTQFPEY
ncbi:MAG: hypothetical protein IKL68_05520 [Clostridia bacterium]|nr:hypothetical protein [Clostridia bacterium]